MELFGIKILEADSTDITEDSTQYNEARFLFGSLAKYNGTYVEVLHDWKIRIWDEIGNVIDEFYLIENDEFREALYSKYPLE